MSWRGGLIPADLSTRLQRMVGFRNIAVRQYQNLDIDIDIVESVIREGLEDLVGFAKGSGRDCPELESRRHGRCRYS